MHFFPVALAYSGLALELRGESAAQRRQKKNAARKILPLFMQIIITVLPKMRTPSNTVAE